jgi:hypothetical protein
MKLLINHPHLASQLVSDLNQTDCLAATTSFDTVEVFVPWLLDGGSSRHAAVELLFFVRAWGAAYPGFRATLVAAGA